MHAAVSLEDDKEIIEASNNVQNARDFFKWRAKMQTTFRLFCHGTYDRFRTYKSATKFFPQLVSGVEQVYRKDIEAILKIANPEPQITLAIIENRADQTMRELYDFIVILQ